MKVAILGTGLMGTAMARRLAETGHEVAVYNRTAERARELAAAGCEVYAAPGDALAGAEAAILTLTDAAAIDEVLFAAPSAASLDGHTVIQMGTIAARESRDLERRLTEKGAQYLEAPVLGSIPEAAAGTLLVMAAGDPEVFARCRPLLQDLGEEPVRIGETGQAAAVKLALNQLIASLTTAFALSLGLVRGAGVDVETFMGILRRSALYAPTFDKKLKRMLERDYANPNFPTRHLEKDIRLFMDEAEGLGLDTAMLKGVERVVARAVAGGLGESDYSALYEGVAGD